MHIGTYEVGLPLWCQSRKGKTGRHRAAPLRPWPPGRHSGRVATEPYPPPRSSFIMMPPKDSDNDSAEISAPADSPPVPPFSAAAPHPACDLARR